MVAEAGGQKDGKQGSGGGSVVYQWVLGCIHAYFVLVSYNWVTLFGATLVTGSAGLIAVFMMLSVMGVIQSPYLGILSFMVLPGIFVTGLLLIPLGAYWQRRKNRRMPEIRSLHKSGALPVLDFNRRRLRDVARTIAILSAINIIIITVVSYEGVVYTESTEFCGLVCHTVMETEFTAYLNSPHSNVECVKCHIGPGVSWYAKAKLSGVRQVIAVALDTYTRPIETPVHNLRPSKDTCEVCHRPEQFIGDRIRVIESYLEDEENSPVYTVLSMHIGGGYSDGKGIHSWHVNDDKTTTYFATDTELQEIPLVRVTDAEGNVKEYRSAGVEVAEEVLASGSWRTMDCIDCHNRPAHIFRPPGKLVDKKIADGTIDRTLPFIKKVGLEALTAAKTAEEVGLYVRSFYEREYSELASTRSGAIAAAVASLETSFRQNVFPEMGVTWGTYENNIGHTGSIGCFRCHDDAHESAGGSVISQDCSLCHSLLAWEEEAPDILEQLGL